MKRAGIFLLSVFAYQVISASAMEHSVSPSRQFVIYGADAAVRGAISNIAEQTKANLLTLLQQRDNWQTPVVVNLQPRQANLPEVPPAALRFSQTGFGLKLQLDLIISRHLDISLVERQLLHAILLEMIYRNQPRIAAGAVFVEPPDWLIEGVLALAPGRDRAPLLESVAATGKPMPLNKFLHEHRELLDPAGRTLYRAYSLALVQMLTDSSDGAARLAEYIAHLSKASSEPLADLQGRFPFLLNDAEGLWQLTLSRLRNAQTFHLLTFGESEQRLEELLRMKIYEPNESARLTDLNELVQRRPSANEKMALARLSRDLLLFAAQANPVLRPIARDYQQIAALLARGKRRRLAKRLSRLEATHKQLAARMSDIDDYMNWFEATQMKTSSGNFTNYLKEADQARMPAPKRHDPLSVYLDAVEDEF